MHRILYSLCFRAVYGCRRRKGKRIKLFQASELGSPQAKGRAGCETGSVVHRYKVALCSISLCDLCPPLPPMDPAHPAEAAEHPVDPSPTLHSHPFLQVRFSPITWPRRAKIHTRGRGRTGITRCQVLKMIYFRSLFSVCGTDPKSVARQQFTVVRRAIKNNVLILNTA